MIWPKFVILKQPDQLSTICGKVFTIIHNDERLLDDVGFFGDRNRESNWHRMVKFQSESTVTLADRRPGSFVYYAPETDPLIVEMVLAQFRTKHPGTGASKQQTAGKKKGQNK